MVTKSGKDVWMGTMGRLASNVPLPSLIKPTLIAGALGAGVGLLFKRNPWKWGLAAGGVTGLLGVVAEGSFALGVGMCMTAAAKEMGVPPEVMSTFSDQVRTEVAQARVGWSFPFTDPYGDYALQRRPSIDSSLEYDPALFFDTRGPQGGPRDFRGIPGYHLGSGWGFWGHGF